MITSLFIFTLVAIIFTKLTASPAKADWYNDGWGYRVSLTFTNSGSAVTNQKVQFTIANTNTLVTAGKMQSACQDIRFTDASGKILQYYIVSGCNSASTVINVLMPSIPVGGNLVYMYYSNPTAAAGGSASDFAVTQFTTGSITQGSETIGPGPVAYWNFDEGYGTTANDLSGHSYSGTFSNSPTWATEDMCVSGKCLQFPGSNASVTVSSTVPSVETVSFWVKSATSSAALITLSSGANIKAAAGVISAPGFTSPTIYVNGVPGSTLSANQWTHVEVTTGTSISASAITIAKVSSNYLVGFLDEFKLYPYARTAAQVLTDYNAGKSHAGTSHGTNVSFGGSTTNSDALSNGLIGYWKLDETASPAIDSSGNSNSGTWSGSPSATTGKFGNSISLNGSNQYASASDANSLGVSGSFTASAWIYPTSIPVCGSIISKSQNNYTINYFIDICSGHPEVGFYNGALDEISSSTTLSTNTWYHITGVFDNSDKKFYLYINGSLNKTSSTINHTPAGNTGSLYIGREQAGNYFPGLIDEARVYNRALSASEVTQLYNWAPGPVGYWPMDENTGILSTFDKSGNGYTGSLAGSPKPAWVPGKYGSALLFDGQGPSDQLITASTHTNLDMMPALTAEAWINPNSEGEFGVGRIIDKATGNSGLTGWEFQMQLTGNKELKFLLDTDGTDVSRTTSATSFPSYNTWVHVAVSWDGSIDSTHVHIYINGIEAGYSSTSAASGNRVDDTSSTLKIGSDSTKSREFDGSIDDVRVYNYVRTGKQIIQDMNGGHPAPGSPVGSSLIHYDFNEASGTTLHNTGNFGSSANATVSGTLWNPDGKSYSAQQFNGTSSYISSPKLALLAADSNTYNTLSWGGWFKPTSTAASKTLILKPKEFQLTTDSSSRPNCAIYSGSWQTAAVAISALPLNTWSHIQCTYDGANINVYVNGLQANGPVSQTGNLTSSNTTGLNLGWNYAGGQYFQGLMDDIKVYNLPLTDDQIKQEYNRSSAAVLGSLSTTSTGTATNSASAAFCIPGDTSTCNPPFAYWKFDENSGTIAHDSSGNNLNLSSQTGTWAVGKNGSALRVQTGQSSGSKTLGSYFNQASAFTISYWANIIAESTDGDPYMAEMWTGTYQWISIQASVPSHPSRLYFNIDNGSDARGYADNLFTYGQWVHIEEVYNGNGSTNADRLKAYINGQPVSLTFSGTIPATTADLSSGGYFPLSAAQNTIIDDFKIYNYARTPAQVAWDYNRGAPIAWYKLDECTGTTAYDTAPQSDPRTTSSLNGTITPGTSGQTAVGDCSTNTNTMWYNGRSGKYGSSLNFDGVDDNVISNLVTNQINNFSVSAWVKWAGTTTSDQLIVFDGNGGSCNGWGLNIRYNDSNAVEVLSNCNGSATTNFVLPTGTWVHLTAVVQNGAATIYVNGAPINTNNSSYVTPGTPTTRTAIGSRGDTGSFNGQLDDVRIYNYALTPTQVQTLYNNSSAVSF